MGVVWAAPNAGRRAFLRRPASPRLVTGCARGEVGAIARSDLPEIEQRRRYLAALARIVNRIHQT